MENTNTNISPAAVTLTTTARTLYNALRAVALFASKDSTRAHLCGVRLLTDGSGYELVATDGHTLARYTSQRFSRDAANAAATIGLADVKRALAVLKPAGKRDERPATVEIHSDMDIRINGLQVIGTGTEFPPYGQVIPAQGKCVDGVFFLQGAYLERTGKALRFVDAGGANAPVRVQGGGLEPIRLDAYCRDVAAELTIVVMPCRGDSH